jgi:hypothetical protein
MGISTGVAAPADLAQALRRLDLRQPETRQTTGVRAEKATSRILQIVESLNS